MHNMLNESVKNPKRKIKEVLKHVSSSLTAFTLGHKFKKKDEKPKENIIKENKSFKDKLLDLVSVEVEVPEVDKEDEKINVRTKVANLIKKGKLKFSSLSKKSIRIKELEEKLEQAYEKNVEMNKNIEDANKEICELKLDGNIKDSMIKDLYDELKITNEKNIIMNKAIQEATIKPEIMQENVVNKTTELKAKITESKNKAVLFEQASKLSYDNVVIDGQKMDQYTIKEGLKEYLAKITELENELNIEIEKSTINDSLKEYKDKIADLEKQLDILRLSK